MRTASRLAAVALTVVLATVGCSDDAGPGRELDEITVGDATYTEGEQVTLEGLVTQAYGNQAFELSGEGFDPGLIVIDVDTEVEEGQTVRVTGTVMRYNEAELGDEVRDSLADVGRRGQLVVRAETVEAAGT